MPLFPLDIRHQEFSGQMFGYNKKEVHAFLEQIASELEDLLKKQERELVRREQMQDEVT
ncbi:MAG TPA: cell division protein DivIVA, partial [Candidatus Cloacimonas sp.]|nr:cell division protein DivIVA [Candidatus Cloacimonas sp.]